MPQIGDQVTVHFLDSEYGSMPTTTTGLLGAPVDGRLVVGERHIIPTDVWTIHTGTCESYGHPRDQRSDKARDNFRRKYE